MHATNHCPPPTTVGEEEYTTRVWQRWTVQWWLLQAFPIARPLSASPSLFRIVAPLALVVGCQRRRWTYRTHLRKLLQFPSAKTDCIPPVFSNTKQSLDRPSSRNPRACGPHRGRTFLTLQRQNSRLRLVSRRTRRSNTQARETLLSPIWVRIIPWWARCRRKARRGGTPVPQRPPVHR